MMQPLGLVGVLLIATDDDDTRPCSREGLGCRETDSAPPARDHREFALQSIHRETPRVKCVPAAFRVATIRHRPEARGRS
jgi:hypothetical protein